MPRRAAGPQRRKKRPSRLSSAGSSESVRITPNRSGRDATSAGPECKEKTSQAWAIRCTASLHFGLLQTAGAGEFSYSFPRFAVGEGGGEGPHCAGGSGEGIWCLGGQFVLECIQHGADRCHLDDAAFVRFQVVRGLLELDGQLVADLIPVCPGALPLLGIGMLRLHQKP